MTVSSIKAWYLVHKWSSLVCTAFLLLLCLTGLPLIFHHEIDRALGYSADAPALPETQERVSLDPIIADARYRNADDAVQFLVRDPDEPLVWFVRMGETIDAPEASAFYTYDARTGDFLSAYPLGTGVMNVIFRLHYDLFAGLPGTLFLGAMGLLFLAALVSGVVLYGPFMRKLPFGRVRYGQSRRLVWLDLHNLIGIATLVWLLVVGATGVINTQALPIFHHWQSTQLAEMTAGAGEGPPPPLETISVQAVVDAARAAEPEMDLSFMAFPGNGFAGPNHFVAFMQGASAWTSKLLKPVLIEARSARVVDARDLPWHVTALLLSQPLHFGDYGGLPLKILWAVLDVLAVIVLGSGLYLWVKRRNVPFEAWLAGLQAERARPGDARKDAVR